MHDFLDQVYLSNTVLSLITLGVAYETSPDVLARVPVLVEAAVAGVPDPAAAQYKFPRIQDEVNRRTHASFAAEGVKFAYPTRTLIVRNAGSGGVSTDSPSRGSE